MAEHRPRLTSEELNLAAANVNLAAANVNLKTAIISRRSALIGLGVVVATAVVGNAAETAGWHRHGVSSTVPPYGTGWNAPTVTLVRAGSAQAAGALLFDVSAAQCGIYAAGQGTMPAGWLCAVRVEVHNNGPVALPVAVRAGLAAGRLHYPATDAAAFDGMALFPEQSGMGDLLFDIPRGLIPDRLLIESLNCAGPPLAFPLTAAA